MRSDRQCKMYEMDGTNAEGTMKGGIVGEDRRLREKQWAMVQLIQQIYGPIVNCTHPYTTRKPSLKVSGER